MTTWAQPIRHPWFNPQTTKRKLYTDADDDADASFSSEVPPTAFSPSRRKRVRYDSLERTLAHMTLDNALATTSEDVDMWPKISPPRPCEQETLNVILPSSVEEPGTLPASEPVDMEVEPTLVTTDNSDTKMPPHGGHEWESTASGRLDIKEVEISPAILECLRRQSRHPPVPIPLPPQTCQALVLYHAPRPPSPTPVEHVCEDRDGKRTRTSIMIAHEDDVMQVE